jgi:hypothetical protein
VHTAKQPTAAQQQQRQHRTVDDGRACVVNYFSMFKRHALLDALEQRLLVKVAGLRPGLDRRLGRVVLDRRMPQVRGAGLDVLQDLVHGCGWC